MKRYWKIRRKTESIIWRIFREWRISVQKSWIRWLRQWKPMIIVNIRQQMWKMHLHIRNVPRRISVRCYHRQPFRFWKRLPRQLRRRQENILETVFICSHRFILQTIVKTIVFIVDLTVTIRSTAHSWMRKRLRKKWQQSQRRDYRKSWSWQGKAAINLQ